MRAEQAFNLRLPPDLKEWVKAEAAANSRSMNSEIEHCLKQARAGRADHEGGDRTAGEASRA